jgi:hypothetical protein
LRRLPVHEAIAGGRRRINQRTVLLKRTEFFYPNGITLYRL